MRPPAKILPILEAALAAVDPAGAVQNVLQRSGDMLTVGDHHYNLADYRRVFVLGAGKAGAPMTQAVETVLGDRISSGLVVVKTDHGGPTTKVEIAEASHPMPDEAGVIAGGRILALAAQATADDLRDCTAFWRWIGAVGGTGGRAHTGRHAGHDQRLARLWRDDQRDQLSAQTLQCGQGRTTGAWHQRH
ncbi:MAG: DUF4147 domain-containing protein [Caldilineaceae bacterium]